MNDKSDSMNFNHEAFYLINSGLRNPVFDFVMPILSNAGGLAVLATICLILLILARRNAFNLARYYGLIRLCIASLLLCVVITGLLKLGLHFKRPSLVLDNVNLLTSSVDPTSFPSGHTACSFSIISVILLKSREFFKRYRAVNCLIIVYAILIAFSRVYIGMHFPLDVVAGAIIGTLSGMAICRYLKV